MTGLLMRWSPPTSCNTRSVLSAEVATKAAATKQVVRHIERASAGPQGAKDERENHARYADCNGSLTVTQPNTEEPTTTPSAISPTTAGIFSRCAIVASTCAMTKTMNNSNKVTFHDSLTLRADIKLPV